MGESSRALANGMTVDRLRATMTGECTTGQTPLRAEPPCHHRSLWRAHSPARSLLFRGEAEESLPTMPVSAVVRGGSRLSPLPSVSRDKAWEDKPHRAGLKPCAQPAKPPQGAGDDTICEATQPASASFAIFARVERPTLPPRAMVLSLVPSAAREWAPGLRERGSRRHRTLVSRKAFVRIEETPGTPR